MKFPNQPVARHKPFTRESGLGRAVGLAELDEVRKEELVYLNCRGVRSKGGVERRGFCAKIEGEFLGALRRRILATIDQQETGDDDKQNRTNFHNKIILEDAHVSFLFTCGELSF